MELWSMVACGHLKTACCMQIWGDIFLSEINIWNDSFPQNIIIIWKKKSKYFAIPESSKKYSAW